mmetsp:Transcript_118679/g.331086  ORF Transcript_118679/g.331086 Transcript_118679/m.331086 type:complete len:368 (-) Transcript_118679:282-1385(-)
MPALPSQPELAARPWEACSSTGRRRGAPRSDGGHALGILLPGGAGAQHPGQLAPLRARAGELRPLLLPQACTCAATQGPLQEPRGEGEEAGEHDEAVEHPDGDHDGEGREQVVPDEGDPAEEQGAETQHGGHRALDDGRVGLLHHARQPLLRAARRKDEAGRDVRGELDGEARPHQDAGDDEGVELEEDHADAVHVDDDEHGHRSHDHGRGRGLQQQERAEDHHGEGDPQGPPQHRVDPDERRPVGEDVGVHEGPAFERRGVDDPRHLLDALDKVRVALRVCQDKQVEGELRPPVRAVCKLVGEDHVRPLVDVPARGQGLGVVVEGHLAPSIVEALEGVLLDGSERRVELSGPSARQRPGLEEGGVQ